MIEPSDWGTSPRGRKWRAPGMPCLDCNPCGGPDEPSKLLSARDLGADRRPDQCCLPCMQPMTNLLAGAFLPPISLSVNPRVRASATHRL